MSGIGKPCYKHNDGRPCYKKNGTQPIYKVSVGDWTQISFAWGSDGSDLDIWAYWEGAPNMCAGFRKESEPQSIPSSDPNSNPDETCSRDGAYMLWWTGDNKTVGGSENIKVKMEPWNGGGSRRLIIKLNFYGYDSEVHPGSTCTVIAAQLGGETKVKRGVECGTTKGSSAVSSAYGVVVSFDETGKLIGVQ